MAENMHHHYYGGLTGNALDHSHRYSGESSRDPDMPGHVHYMSGYTDAGAGHTHYYHFLTGPAIIVEHGHTHPISGFTVFADHLHAVSGWAYIEGHSGPPRINFSPEEAKVIGEHLGVDWTRFDVEQYRMGLNIELEHGRINPATNITDDDPVITGKITLAHLNEFPDYNTRLTKMEDEAEEHFKPEQP